jgi:hypothetical protein
LDEHDASAIMQAIAMNENRNLELLVMAEMVEGCLGLCFHIFLVGPNATPILIQQGVLFSS